MVDRINVIWGTRTPHAPVVERYGEADVEEPERLHASRQLTWLNTRMKQAAPQALIVAP